MRGWTRVKVPARAHNNVGQLHAALSAPRSRRRAATKTVIPHQARVLDDAADAAHLIMHACFTFCSVSANCPHAHHRCAARSLPPILPRRLRQKRSRSRASRAFGAPTLQKAQFSEPSQLSLACDWRRGPNFRQIAFEQSETAAGPFESGAIC